MTTSPVKLANPSPFHVANETIATRRFYDAHHIIDFAPLSSRPIRKDRVTQLPSYEPLVDDPLAIEELRGMNLVPANEHVESHEEMDRSIVTSHPAITINLDSVPRYTESSSPKVQSHEGDRLLDVERGVSSTKKSKNCATSKLVQFTAFACFCVGSILVFGGIALRFRSHS